MFMNGKIYTTALHSSKRYGGLACCSNLSKREHHFDKGVDLQMKKMIMRKNMQKKLDLASEISQYELQKSPVKLKAMKITSRSARLRNKTVANLIKNELQNLVDSGELGVDIQNLNLTFTKATLSSYNKCQVFWEPYMSTKDLEIADCLNKLSAKFRHLLMTNLVMNNVPELQFYMDGESYRVAVIDGILRMETLDVGDSSHCAEDTPAPIHNASNTPTAATDQARGLDREAMLGRLTAALSTKASNKN